MADKKNRSAPDKSREQDPVQYGEGGKPSQKEIENIKETPVKKEDGRRRR